MAGAGVARAEPARGNSRALFDKIGDFLVAQRLEFNPANYAFAHAIMAYPDGQLAREVARLTDGGVRLTLKEIEALGAEVSTDRGSIDGQARADGLVAQTQMQVEGFEDVVEHLRAETIGFGRDLAASADAIRNAQDDGQGGAPAVEAIARITAAMVARVHATEVQLDLATREAAELRTKLEEARDNARRDPLTDLPNRRAFEEAFAANLAAETTQVLAVCDVDHFKSVNDRFGHAVGDRVLKAIGTALAEACGDHMVARYGGEEFVVLFTGIDAGKARATLEAARAQVEAKRYKLRENDAPLGAVTVSAGLAPAVPDDTAKQAFQRADALLYLAKSEGRNRVRVG
ncbi:diguanylate cyclase [Sphingomonas donggukensis]|uniref:diguanylate cyclase n=1 Tax=Sphingomonas donggukensis TaxID=2949093 RepID=A0ABY4TYI2_9SPHN|nr:GGDEF domain-containing protein [Sphingomonas donggukensis]URW75606.1 diguanylate cyclase [Sphingomonas donggukensis]